MYTIAEYQFVNINEIRDVVDKIKSSAPIGYLDDANDERFLIELFRYHPNAENKFANSVNPRIKYSGEYFIIERDDGSTTDISVIKVLRKSVLTRNQKKIEKENLHRDIASACRHSISEQVKEFKDAFWKDYPSGYCECPVSRKCITRYNSDVDHYPVPFRDILADFLQTGDGSTLMQDKLLHKDNELGCRFVDKDLERKWQDYHKFRARYRIIDAYTNRYIVR